MQWMFESFDASQIDWVVDHLIITFKHVKFDYWDMFDATIMVSQCEQILFPLQEFVIEFSYPIH